MNIKRIEVDKNNTSMETKPLIRLSLLGEGCSLEGCNCSPGYFLLMSDGQTCLSASLNKEEADLIREGHNTDIREKPQGDYFDDDSDHFHEERLLFDEQSARDLIQFPSPEEDIKTLLEGFTMKQVIAGLFLAAKSDEDRELINPAFFKILRDDMRHSAS
jgi:hypothetical protein